MANHPLRQAADHELALGADVEQTAAEGEGHADAREDEGYGIADVTPKSCPVPKAPTNMSLERVEWGEERPHRGIDIGDRDQDSWTR